MAISRMKRIQILAHESAKIDVVAALREGGVLHITEPSIDPGLLRRADPARAHLRELQGQHAKLEYVRGFLKPYAPKKKDLGKVLYGKLHVDENEFQQILDGCDADGWHQRCVALEGRVRAAEAEIARKESLATELAHWTPLGTRVEEVHDSARVRIGLLSVGASDFGELVMGIGEATAESSVVEISRVSSVVYAFVMFLKDDESRVSPILKRHNARWVDLSGATGTPGEAAERLLAEADRERAGIEKAKEEAAALAAEYAKVLIVLDELAERLAKESAEERFAATRDTFLVEGWIRKRDEAALRARLEQVSPETEMRSRDPEPGEDVPIDFENNAFVRPFEFVMTLYGRPSYWEWDPTPLFAPFFIIFFGLCVGDVIYGSAIALGAWYFMTKQPRGSGGRITLRLLVMGGVTSAIAGALMGSWAGMDVSTFPHVLSRLMLIDPLKNPMPMLNFVFLLGIVHIMFGLTLKMLSEFKQGRWLDGILDQLVWMILAISIVPLCYKYIFGGEVRDILIAVNSKIALIFLIVAALTGGRKNKNPILKVLGGIPKLYGIVNYFADVLSYARLLALGLATGAIAMAINGVAEMARGLPVVGILAAFLVILAGHLFNTAINILGAFVHPARLQYLEFFGKFYTGGGRAFVPFRVARKYSVVQD
jgi:V/A-type H+-transporting ATPase subunit I